MRKLGHWPVNEDCYNQDLDHQCLSQDVWEDTHTHTHDESSVMFAWRRFRACSQVLVCVL